ncbi:carbohydrate porin [Pseudomonas guariconensis]|uniref:carbohydrate porin n=1 Tax=Pseudomonas TaxID=286 RepID=UPI002097ABB8|nr:MULTISPECIES: carbohydrate porin [Pseudomonas]MCO7641726.1 carbohydrate porin [Pseudomonas sp. S 311-6]MCO7516629.1 carbohydrate porin [Pseudomonas putida]MCO7566905.1 carbohydrate porin [Pseudomonas mosselii]MCO7606943.1 carbohydrate porin [Pseudomonas guariconensis]MCO7618203.1 carbohydrate porin [Pseudomonas guariconensis]
MLQLPRSRYPGLALATLLGSLSPLVGASEMFASDSPWMLGDWDGTRSELLEKGYDFTLGYTGEMGSNLQGGYDHDRTARYSDQFTFASHLDLEKILGWHDAEFQLTITERHGQNISNDRINDPRVGGFTSAQEVWGRGQTWRLTQLWIKQKYLDGALDVKFGRFGEGEDFNSFPCDFQNLAFCGSQVGNWVGDIWYNWPVSQWALRVRYNLRDDLYAQVGLFEQNPSNLESGNGFKLSGSGTQGAVMPVELVWSPRVNGLKGEYRAGYYYSNAKAQDVYRDDNGQAAALSGQAYRSRSSKHGFWLGGQQQLTSLASDQSRGLSLFANATLHDKKTNAIDNYVQAGVVYKGPFDARAKDDIGFALARVHVNPAYRKNARLINQAVGLDDYDNPGYLPVQDTEYSAELYYGIHLADWLTVRPNLQYIRHPGGVSQVDAALIGGLKIQSSF